MLNLQQISNAVADVSMRRISIEEFERWLRKESRNFHASGDAVLVSAVLSVETVLSEYRFAEMTEAIAAQELANAICHFAVPRK